MSRDPASYADGLNLYGYFGASPFVKVDPFGLNTVTNETGGWMYVEGDNEEDPEGPLLKEGLKNGESSTIPDTDSVIACCKQPDGSKKCKFIYIDCKADCTVNCVPEYIVIDDHPTDEASLPYGPVYLLVGYKISFKCFPPTIPFVCKHVATDVTPSEIRDYLGT